MYIDINIHDNSSNCENQCEVKRLFSIVYVVYKSKYGLVHEMAFI